MNGLVDLFLALTMMLISGLYLEFVAAPMHESYTMDGTLFKLEILPLTLITCLIFWVAESNIRTNFLQRMNIETILS